MKKLKKDMPMLCCRLPKKISDAFKLWCFKAGTTVQENLCNHVNNTIKKGKK